MVVLPYMPTVEFPIPRMRRRDVAASHRRALSQMSVGESDVFPLIDRSIIGRAAREIGYTITTKQIGEDRIRVWIVSTNNE